MSAETKISALSGSDLQVFPEHDSHKKVFKIEDPSVGLIGFISIHNTNLGPAVGGTRFWFYENERVALRDGLRLSRAMTYKCAIAGVPFGGAKAVLMAPSADLKKTDAYLNSYAEIVNTLGEIFYTGEDVGLNEHDIKVLAASGKTIVGRPGVGGLPAYWAGLSVFVSMQAAVKKLFNKDSFSGLSVAIKGVGGLGIELAEMLYKDGAKIFISDINPERIKLAEQRKLEFETVHPAEIHKQKVDIYAPCAMGDEFTSDTIEELSCKIICGGANNQLASGEEGKKLFQKNILYIPDYLANSGGLINVVDELKEGGYSAERVTQNINNLKNTVDLIIDQSGSEKRPTNEIADMIAEKRFFFLG